MDSTWVDFKVVRRTVSMEMVLDRYGISAKLRRVNSSSLRGPCPLPGHASKTSSVSFTVNTDRNIWACQSGSCVAARSGKKGGNVLDFIAEMERCSIRDAALKLQDWFSVDSEDRPATQPVPARAASAETTNASDTVENKPLTFELKDVDAGHEYLQARGIRAVVASELGVGFFPGKGTMSRRVVIPIHNERGDLVAYAGRSVDGSEPKYKFPTGFRKSLELWNLNRCRGLYVILVEGFFDAMKIHQAGHPAAALMGCSLSSEQERKLARFQQVVVMLDGDEAGRKATAEIVPRIARVTFVHVIDLPDGVQPDQLSSAEIQRLLSFS